MNVSARALRVLSRKVIIPVGREIIGGSSRKNLSGGYVASVTIEVGNIAIKRPVASNRWHNGIEKDSI